MVKQKENRLSCDTHDNWSRKHTEKSVHDARGQVLNDLHIRMWFKEHKPQDLKDIISSQDTYVITSKQVPTALAIAGSGNKLLKTYLTEANRAGVPVELLKWDNLGDFYTEQVPTCDDYENKIVHKHGSDFSGSYTSEGFGETTSSSSKEYIDLIGPRQRVQVVYEDPFKLLAARQWLLNNNEKPQPLLHWPGNSIRLIDKIPSTLIKGWKGKPRQVELTEVDDPEMILKFLGYRTFWGRANRSYCEKGHKYKTFATQLWRTLRYFLHGLPDPSWSKTKVTRIYGEKWEPRKTTSRLFRLLEVLKTVDGMFIQRFETVYPEFWNWEKFDRFVLYNLSILLEDEFVDGILNPDIRMDLPMNFKALKDVRKHCKSRCHGNADLSTEERKNRPPWLKYFDDMADHILEIPDIFVRTQRTNHISQTRGASLAPPYLVLQAKVKALKTYTIPATNPTKTLVGLISNAVDSSIKDIPDEWFTGLKTKASVTVTSAACWENTRSEEGTLAALHEIVQGYEGNTPVLKLDLINGRDTELLYPEGCEVGEYVFWVCIRHILSTNPSELTKVMLVVANEPGKARIVTKGVAALKIVLDVVSGMCSYPLKGSETSSSGMERSNHAWNFFRGLFSSKNEEIIFEVKSIKNEGFNDHTVVTKQYKTYRHCPQIMRQRPTT